jgi:maltooligosyltrehalose trehalohydrolase
MNHADYPPNPGARLTAAGVRYCLWAPDHPQVSVEIEPAAGGTLRTLKLTRAPDGYHSAIDAAGDAGDAYAYRIGGGNPLPDPASRAQQTDVHGRSLVVDPKTFAWSDAGWQRPAFRDLVIYELHLGTFTPGGTFRAAIERLPYLKDLGITALEIMPVGDFPGKWNWGYDGVLIYAPARCYGSPDDFRALVDAAHRHGLAVLLDVVYNHFGPDGNYLTAYSRDYFNQRHHTPWGDAFNFDTSTAGPVREFFRANPAYWMEEFHIDGFRLDATHEIKDNSMPHILAEMTASVHARGGYVIAEDSRNLSTIITPTSDDGIGFDGVWADDFHHAARVMHTGEKHAYFADFEGTMDEVTTALRDGWIYNGQFSKLMNESRGSIGSHLPPQSFVHCLSNHDQTGNRALGERLHQLIPPAAYRALSMLLCLSPATPMLFMGQEFGAGTPFQFFTDHHDELGRAVTKGRRKEFASFPEFSKPEAQKKIPDPQAESTFLNSKLNWSELDAKPHQQLLALYRECLKLRALHAAFRPVDRKSWQAHQTVWGYGMIHTIAAGGRYLLLFDLPGGHAGKLPVEGNWKLVLSSEEARFGGSGNLGWTRGRGLVTFRQPETILLREG